MCGIGGIISFTADLSERHRTADAFAAALHDRGPESGGRRLSRHAMLVFTRLAVIDPAGGGQPMVGRSTPAGGGRPEPVVLAYTGEIFNFRELRGELIRRGHRFDTDSDTEVVLRAYEEWGPACAERLRGMFAFAVWDAAAEQLHLIRDRFGIYPLHYTLTGEGFAFASEPKALFRTGQARPVVDRDGLRELLGYTPTPGLTVFRDVREVIPGEIVTFGRNGLARRRYWDLPAREHTDGLAETIATVREILEDSVRRQVVSDVPLGVMLSGGLDSGIVSALADREVGAAAGGDRLRTFSMEYVYNLANFRSDEMHESPDSPHVATMVEHLGADHSELLVTTDDLMDPVQQLAVVNGMDRPIIGLETHVAFRRLASRMRPTATVALCGDGADELFGGYIWFQDPWYVQAPTFPWIGPFHGMEMHSGLVDRQLYQELDVPGHIDQRYREALAETPLTGEETAEDRRMREITHLNLTRYLRTVLDRRDRMGQAGPLEGRVPFVDHVLVEYVYNIPWAMKNLDGREKGLLRAAMGDLLPDSIVRRGKSPFPTAQDPAYRQSLRKQLQTISEDRSSAVAELLDPKRVEAVLSDPSQGLGAGVNRLSIEAALQLHYWTTECGVEFAL
ncbi:asparagine synthase (glutamine-hydrolyzing) [Streptomyces sp. NPDC056670]|uniref:asparagine synthase (glutamine-hydrolyzing) n=1 Tax=Streptomyces sp. NPDC056670 TaxID=3345904 RepID=UPI0036A98EF7